MQQVQGSRQGDHYTVFPLHYCSCQAFLYTVVGQSHPLVGTPQACYFCLCCADRVCLRMHAAQGRPHSSLKVF